MSYKITTILTLAILPIASLAQPHIGSRRSEVDKELGAPTITKKSDDGTVTCVYPGIGVIKFKNDIATSLKIKSERELQEEKDKQLEAIETKKLQVEQGDAAHYELIVSPDYLSATIQGKLNMADKFLAKHPYPEMAEIRANILQLAPELDSAIKEAENARSILSSTKYNKQENTKAFLLAARKVQLLETPVVSSLNRFEQYARATHNQFIQQSLIQKTKKPVVEKTTTPDKGLM